MLPRGPRNRRPEARCFAPRFWGGRRGGAVILIGCGSWPVSDLKLFRISGGQATELMSSSVKLEKSLQEVVERNMETLFGVRFLASEYGTGARHGGRIDSL